MSGPRTKRQFAGDSADLNQRTITHFWSATPTSSLPTRGATTKLGDLQKNTISASNSAPKRPVPPPNVQSNLLSVGMRVRKSVPEGYKTGEKYSGGLGLFGEASYTSLHATAASYSTVTTATSTAEGVLENKVQAVDSGNELLPFCGINKVGGLNFQQQFPSSQEQDGNNEVALGVFSVPILSSSQATIPGSQESAVLNTNVHKRSYAEDERKPTSAAEPFIVGLMPGFMDDSHHCHEHHSAGARMLSLPQRQAVKVKSNTCQHRGSEDETDFPEAEFLDYKTGYGLECDSIYERGGAA